MNDAAAAARRDETTDKSIVAANCNLSLENGSLHRSGVNVLSAPSPKHLRLCFHYHNKEANLEYLKV